MNAFKEGKTIFNQDNMNELLALQPFTLLYEGTVVDSKTGSGTTINDASLYNFAIRFTVTDVTGITRGELNIAADGSGQDLTIEVRGSDFATDGSSNGTLIKTIVVPKEFLPSTTAYWSIPINLSGLTAGSNYWLIVKKVGDTTNHFHLVGEASQDAAHPCYYRSGTSGAWTTNNALHFNVYSGVSGLVLHEIYGVNGCVTVTYSDGVPQKQYYYIPPADGPDGGIRSIMTLNYSSGLIVGGDV